MVTARSALLFAAAAAAAQAQLAWWGDYLPKHEKPPVIFVTGHDAVCPAPGSGELPFFELTFGQFDKVMTRDGRVSLVFEACFAPNRPSIEELAELLRRLIAPLRYEGGEPVRELDVVAHSMGGLIVRSYLAGRQTNGSFAPPAEPRIRRIVFIGTPHFGTNVAPSTSTDPQLREMSFGSTFLFDLATWNQGADDLRGIPALSIAGTGGRNGPATDSVVTVPSASIDFAGPGRTVVLPYCHTQGGIGQLFLCNGAPGLARVADENHPTARLVLSFLNDTGEWRSAASAATSAACSVMVQTRSVADVRMPIRSAALSYDNGARASLSVSDSGIAFAEMLPAGPALLNVDGIARRVSLPSGGSLALVVKTGPLIDTVQPAAGPSRPLLLAPGMLVSIAGNDLNSGAVVVSLSGNPVRVLAATATEITAVLPENVTGLADLTVRNAAGQHTVRVLLESAVPALFLRDGRVAAIRASSDIVSVFLTGLGAGQSPVVTVNEQPCELLYAGRAPGLPGVDQINCRLPQFLRSGLVRLAVTAGKRTAAAELLLQ
jgi:uncharacterized protein (TIGR03437 family)